MKQNADPKEQNQTRPERVLHVGDLIGSATGEAEDILTAGGWAGTDDDTSTAPSDRIGLPPEDRLAELTGGAISDDNPLIEGAVETRDDLDEAIADAEDRIIEGGHRSH